MPVDSFSSPAGARQAVQPPGATTADHPSPLAGDLALVRIAAWVRARAMFVIAIGAVLIISLLAIPLHLSQDGWLALIAGRIVAAHGIPQHDYFSHMTYGARWVDQQWLAQLLMYELQRLGGLQLMTVLYVAITGAAFSAAIAAGRNLGGEDLHVLIAALPGAFFYLVTAVAIRTQGLAYPLFIATLWLLVSEARSPVRRRRVYLVLPMLVLWGNLHGSATLGAGLVGLYGLLVLVERVRSDGSRGLRDRRAWLLMVLAPLTLLATPYGSGMIHYYKVTLLNPQFGKMVTEWKPVTSVIGLAVPLFVMLAVSAAAIAVVLWRSRAGAGRRPTTFELLTLLVLAIGAILAVRNVTWFGLAVLALLPPILTQARGGRAAPLRRSRLNLLLALATSALVLVSTVVVLGRPSAWFTRTYPSSAIPTLRRLIARDPRARILADVRYADWLIWEDPRLFSGRVAYDTSFELLSRRQLAAIADLAANTTGARSLLDGYRIWILNPATRSIDRTLLRRPGVHLVTRTHRVIIATHRVGT